MTCRGQTGHETFIVLVDPEGNEFRVLSATLNAKIEAGRSNASDHAITHSGELFIDLHRVWS